MRLPEKFRMTAETAKSIKATHPKRTFQNFFPKPVGDSTGSFVVPKIGKPTGWFYHVLVGHDDKHNYVSFECIPEVRPLTIFEVAHLRNLFFAPSEYVVQFIPSQTERLAERLIRTTLFELKEGGPLPSMEDVGNWPGLIL